MALLYEAEIARALNATRLHKDSRLGYNGRILSKEAAKIEEPERWEIQELVDALWNDDVQVFRLIQTAYEVGVLEGYRRSIERLSPEVFAPAAAEEVNPF